MRSHHRHLLRTATCAVATAALWYWLVPPPYPGLRAQPASWWQGLGTAELVVLVSVPVVLAVLLFFTGPDWHAALVTNRMRAGARYRRSHGWSLGPLHFAPKGRKAVPTRMERITFWVDGYACIYCHAVRQLADKARGFAGVHICWDHIRPHDRGGKVSAWNGGTLCGHCNVVKSDVWIYTPGGKPYYNPVTERGFSEAHLAQALDILRVELARRRHPVRLARLLIACVIF